MKKIKSEPFITIVALVASLLILLCIGLLHFSLAFNPVSPINSVNESKLQETLIESAASYGYYCAQNNIPKAKCLYDVRSGGK
jgi:hypothetical protein